MLADTALDLKGNQVTRDTFPLKALGAILDGVSAEIYEGRGFGLVRGLDAQKYTTEDLTLIYLGVQSYVADQRGRQDAKGNMLGEPPCFGPSLLLEQHAEQS